MRRLRRRPVTGAMRGCVPHSVHRGDLVRTAAHGAHRTAPAGKYAENQLAAQLLAAKTNVAVGATCGTIARTIAQADGLLRSIGYAGSPSSKIGAKHAMRATALSLASTLDSFANGLLC